MNREQAELLLAAYLFDELDPADRARLERYLQTDSSLREQLADMRLAVKLLDRAIGDEPTPMLSEERRQTLLALAQTPQPHRRRVIGRVGRIGRMPVSHPFLMAALILLGVGLLAVLMLPALSVNTRKWHSAEFAEVDDVASSDRGKQGAEGDAWGFSKKEKDGGFYEGLRPAEAKVADDKSMASSADMPVPGQASSIAGKTFEGQGQAGGEKLVQHEIELPSPKFAGTPKAVSDYKNIASERTRSSTIAASGEKNNLAGINGVDKAAPLTRETLRANEQAAGSGKMGKEYDADNRRMQESQSRRTEVLARQLGDHREMTNDKWTGRPLNREDGGGGLGRPMSHDDQLTGAVPLDGDVPAIGNLFKRPSVHKPRSKTEKLTEIIKKDIVGDEGRVIVLADRHDRSTKTATTPDAGLYTYQYKQRPGHDSTITRGGDIHPNKRPDGLAGKAGPAPAGTSADHAALEPAPPPASQPVPNGRNRPSSPEVPAETALLSKLEGGQNQNRTGRVVGGLNRPEDSMDSFEERFHDAAKLKEKARQEHKRQEWYGRKTQPKSNINENRQRHSGRVAETDPHGTLSLKDGNPADAPVFDLAAVVSDEENGKSGSAIFGDADADGKDAYHSAAAPTTKPAPVQPQTVDALPPASRFRLVPVNPWVLTQHDHLSTFALDVDTASYALCRRYLMSGYLPPRGAVRMEEFVNAFDYNYPRLARGVFNVFAEAAPSPFARTGEDLVLLKVGVQGKVIGRAERKAAHLVFVVDTSGSMARSDRLPLVRYALKQLVGQLGPADRVSLITYGSKAHLRVEAVPATQRAKIQRAIDRLKAGDATNLLAGLKAGYALARREFVAGRINRVIVCTDGAANVGQTDAKSILQQIVADRVQGITLTVAGFGQGGYNDELLESLAKRGDGNYLFIDSADEARRLFVEQMSATLQTIARDAKIQVDFNPQRVRRYRLIGYEKRDIADELFRDDTVDAAEVGSGRSATALYELELFDAADPVHPDTLGTVYVRYRDADTDAVREIAQAMDGHISRAPRVDANPRFYLAACAARFAELLRGSEHAAGGNFGQVQSVMEEVCQALPLDQQARQLLDLIRRAKGLPRAPGG